MVGIHLVKQWINIFEVWHNLLENGHQLLLGNDAIMVPVETPWPS